MTKLTARQIIEAIESESAEPLSNEQILDVLEDGAALSALGLTDDDQEAIEEAHYLVKTRMNPTMTYRTYFDVYEAIVNHCIKTSRPLIEAIEDAEVLAALGLGADEKEAVEWVYMHAHVYWLVNKKTGEMRSADLEKICAELGISTVRSEYEADVGMADWCDILDQRIISAIENSDWIDFPSYKDAQEWASENFEEA